MNANARRLLAGFALAGCALLSGCERPPVDTVQRGFRGTGMVEVYNPRAIEVQQQANQVPAALPAAPAGGLPPANTYKNVQVLKNLSVPEMTRLMLAMTAWVAPQQGCAYCHAPGQDLASDALYTKVVARRMLQMTQHINDDWKNHVADTGVTCYTCHRGKPVPDVVWFTDPGPRQAKGMAGSRAEQNSPAPQVGLTSLPYDPFTPFLSKAGNIKVVSGTALPAGSTHTIKQTEWTYALMMHISKSLGVNCTYCHNSRSFTNWDESTPQRVTAWHGIRLARDLNVNYLEPLASQLPENRRGSFGDAPKVNCGTCHQGAYKPLYGASMLKDYPELVANKAVPAVVAKKP
jgi:photosynthetic reaction center cytochrome c subunit